MQRRRAAAAVDRGDAHADVLDVALGVLDHDVEERVVGEDARVDQLVLALLAPAPRVLFA